MFQHSSQFDATPLTPLSEISNEETKRLHPSNTALPTGKKKNKLLCLGLKADATKVIKALFPNCYIRKAANYDEWLELGKQPEFKFQVISDQFYTFETYNTAIEQGIMLIRVMNQEALKAVHYTLEDIQPILLPEIAPQYVKLDFKAAFTPSGFDLFHSTQTFDIFGDFPPAWYSTEPVVDVDTDKEKVLYVPWMKTHGDKFVQQISQASSGLEFIPFHILNDIERRDYRSNVIAFARSYPDLYKKLLLKKLLPIHKSIKKAVVTFDWQPCMMIFVEACKMLGIKTILVPHESVFASSDLYYKCLVTGLNKPACDVAYLWGGLQHQIFEARGYEPSKMHVMGTPKLDEYFAYAPLVNKEIFCDIMGLDPEKPIVLYATQLLDSQFESSSEARKAQNNAIKDMINWCHLNHCQFIIRTPPSKDNILFNSTKNLVDRCGCGIIDDARLYMFSPEEVLYHSDMILSFNSTMLFEGTLLNKAAISTRYIDFEPLWGKLGIPVASHTSELHAYLTYALGVKSSLATPEGMAWARHQFSNGVLDGGAARRIAEAIKVF